MPGIALTYDPRVIVEPGTTLLHYRITAFGVIL